MASYGVICFVFVDVAEEMIRKETSEKGGLAQIAWLFINDRCVSMIARDHSIRATPHSVQSVNVFRAVIVCS